MAMMVKSDANVYVEYPPYLIFDVALVGFWISLPFDGRMGKTLVCGSRIRNRALSSRAEPSRSLPSRLLIRSSPMHI
jgi:hypothetical protein